MDNQAVATASPFHRGEQDIQARLGVRDKAERIGRIMIRPYMPEQHRDFYEQLPFIVAGAVDADGWPWATLIPGDDGFISAPDDRLLRINGKPSADDPVHKALASGQPIGLLGIELAARRRNRVNGRVATVDAAGFTVDVTQSFGNCPQYIHPRIVDHVRPVGEISESQAIVIFDQINADLAAHIETADTFFVTSATIGDNLTKGEGVDVSHRGGQSGFVSVDGNTLTIPDYAGNRHYNTLGNFLANPRAGLVFPDFATGDLVMLTGTVQILWDDDPRISDLSGAERAWQFTLNHGVHIRDALPLRWHSVDAVT